MDRRKLLLIAVFVALAAAFFAFDLGRFLSLDYLKSRNVESYRALIEKLGLRK